VAVLEDADVGPPGIGEAGEQGLDAGGSLEGDGGVGVGVLEDAGRRTVTTLPCSAVIPIVA
jgi:hypothetical protein